MSERKSKRLTKAEGKKLLEDKHQSENDLSARFSALLDKQEEEASRPNPAVGQVWRSSLGNEFAIVKVESNGAEARVMFCDLVAAKIGLPLLPTDVYVGQLVGFKVQDEVMDNSWVKVVAFKQKWGCMTPLGLFEIEEKDEKNGFFVWVPGHSNGRTLMTAKTQPEAFEVANNAISTAIENAKSAISSYETEVGVLG